MGLKLFWKWVDNFDARDHIRIYTEDQPNFPDGAEGRFFTVYSAVYCLSSIITEIRVGM